MKVSVIRETAPAWEPPAVRIQCQHRVNSHELFGNLEWRKQRYGERGNDPEKCQHLAVVELDGVPMCRRHAGMVALDHVLKTHKVAQEVGYSQYVENVLSQGPAVVAKELSRLQEKIVKAQRELEEGRPREAREILCN